MQFIRVLNFSTRFDNNFKPTKVRGPIVTGIYILNFNCSNENLSLNMAENSLFLILSKTKYFHRRACLRLCVSYVCGVCHIFSNIHFLQYISIHLISLFCRNIRDKSYWRMLFDSCSPSASIYNLLCVNTQNHISIKLIFNRFVFVYL